MALVHVSIQGLGLASSTKVALRLWCLEPGFQLDMLWELELTTLFHIHLPFSLIFLFLSSELRQTAGNKILILSRTLGPQGLSQALWQRVELTSQVMEGS